VLPWMTAPWRAPIEIKPFALRKRDASDRIFGCTLNPVTGGWAIDLKQRHVRFNGRIHEQSRILMHRVFLSESLATTSRVLAASVYAEGLFGSIDNEIFFAAALNSIVSIHTFVWAMKSRSVSYCVATARPWCDADPSFCCHVPSAEGHWPFPV
jgi:hypothetical protein